MATEYDYIQAAIGLPNYFTTVGWNVTGTTVNNFCVNNTTDLGKRTITTSTGPLIGGYRPSANTQCGITIAYCNSTPQSLGEIGASKCSTPYQTRYAKYDGAGDTYFLACAHGGYSVVNVSMQGGGGGGGGGSDRAFSDGSGGGGQGGGYLFAASVNIGESTHIYMGGGGAGGASGNGCGTGGNPGGDSYINRAGLCLYAYGGYGGGPGGYEGHASAGSGQRNPQTLVNATVNIGSPTRVSKGGGGGQGYRPGMIIWFVNHPTQGAGAGGASDGISTITDFRGTAYSFAATSGKATLWNSAGGTGGSSDNGQGGKGGGGLDSPTAQAGDYYGAGGGGGFGVWANSREAGATGCKGYVQIKW